MNGSPCMVVAKVLQEWDSEPRTANTNGGGSEQPPLAERGETDLAEMTIETGDAAPKKQAACRLPFAVRKEIA